MGKAQAHGPKTHTAKERPRGENVVDPMDALRKSIGRDAGNDRGAEEASQEGAQGGKEMLMPIAGKESGQRGRGEEASGQTAAEVSLA